MTKPGRIACEVMGCRRTAPAAKYPADTKICCGKCWRLGRAEDRKSYREAWKILGPAERLTPAEEEALPAERKAELVRAEWAAHIAFAAVVATATEARAGIA